MYPLVGPTQVLSKFRRQRDKPKTFYNITTQATVTCWKATVTCWKATVTCWSKSYQGNQLFQKQDVKPSLAVTLNIWCLLNPIWQLALQMQQSFCMQHQAASNPFSLML